MLQVKNILYLVSRDTGGGTGRERAVHLVDSLKATLHAAPVRRQRAAADPSLQTIVEESVRVKPVERVIQSEPSDPEEAIGAIQQYVAEHDIELVIVDPPVKRGAVPPLADPVTRRLVERLDCPIFFLQASAAPSPVEEIVVPTDFSDHSHEALRCAAALAELYGASISLLHVIDTSPYVALTAMDRLSMGNTTLSEHRAYRQLHRFLGKGELAEVSIQPHVAFGDPADRIARFNSEREADLLVLSSHGRQTRSEEPLGRVADRVLGRVTCPVFFLPAFGRSPLSEDADSRTASTSSDGGEPPA